MAAGEAGRSDLSVTEDWLVALMFEHTLEHLAGEIGPRHEHERGDGQSRLAATHRDETVKVAHELTHAKPDDKRAEFISDQAIREKQIDPTLAIPAERIDWMQELFVKAGVIPKAVPTASIIDASVQADAAKLAGK